MAKQWYVIHTQTGYEDRVKTALEAKIKSALVGEKVSQVLVPIEQVSEIKGGKKKISQRKFFPGYILVEMELTDDTWYMIKSITGVTGFVGAGARPIPLKSDEIDTILKQTKDAKEKPTPKVMFEKGEAVRVTEGPFMNFNGTIEEANVGKGKIKIMISIFGRATPVELEMWQVEKI
ncbi:MAG: transcription termination/antitermination factor NusG [Omnitrophica bacterium RIFCSPLOWO2_02_FULL_45_16]|nr:MAG: transcription termination/antitermination factor NusG [Omnitrophica bacterium RIFCSPHIGHO2_02_FULL_46_20]OGW93075.1 MAG: transcription termination/antitermination factor NusG [Omnitrophica bacterium RIFCSPLOWO2_01_FULL_45_24]OGW94334.1 MAG: transcription termination/antitermination factor NusG [Omnitrophica bacterium RIFCSPLOWO2_12_FULL_45_13]OGW99721.1 MAG: transcription termination/antitermination factor NusG [Omnitrophica bacterium RIFCSPLOWO2_02_FULL_45_16]